MTENTGGIDVLAVARTQIEATNALAERIKSASDDGTKRVHDLFASSDDAKVVKVREFVEELDSKRESAIQQVHEYIKANLLVSDDFDLNKGKDEYAVMVKRAKGALEFLSTMGLDVPEDFPAIKGLRGSGGGGTGGRRPRLSSITCDGAKVSGKRPGKDDKGQPDGTTVETHTFTDLAKFLSEESGTKVTAKDLQAAAFEAAGSDDLSTKAGQSVEFTVTYGEHTYNVTVVPADPDAAK